MIVWMRSDTVLASNRLTARWAATLDRDSDSVLSGLGAWVVLAAALSGAAGKAQQELESALGVAKEEAAASVRDLLEYAGLSESVHLATGLWVRPDVSVRDEFVATLMPMTVGALPEDRSVLDRWVNDETSGMLDRFPLDITPDTLIMLASALAVEADWVTPFTDNFPHSVFRSGTDVDSAALLSDGSLTVSRAVCVSEGDFDVHLLAGAEGDSPGPVLGLGIAAISGDADIVVGSALRLGDAGGCLRVEEVETDAGIDSGRRLDISLTPFEISSEHNLVDHPQLFGLEFALDASYGHFPEISATPLAVNAAAQSGLAEFSHAGFRAAAVTGLGLELGFASPPRPTHKIEVVTVDFNRPFGFLVTDRSSGLVSFAGWVAKIPIQWAFEDGAMVATKYWSPTVTTPIA